MSFSSGGSIGHWGCDFVPLIPNLYWQNDAFGCHGNPTLLAFRRVGHLVVFTGQIYLVKQSHHFFFDST